MPVSRPKILTEVTVPTGGWELKFTISDAGSLDTQLTATVAAGTYFVAWDGETDDLIYSLVVAMQSALTGGGFGAGYQVSAYIDTSRKVAVTFVGSYYGGGGFQDDVSIDLTASTSGLCDALGFDSSADVSDTGTLNPTFTGDYQHGYGWYATEDGQLESLLIEDVAETTTPQSVSYAGNVASQHIGERYSNELGLAWLTREQTYSRGVGYGSTPVYPYARNVPLECWWREAREGKRFRVYRDGALRGSDVDYDGYVDRGQVTSTSTTQVVDTAKSLDIDPQERKGMRVIAEHFPSGTPTPAGFEIASNTATALTATNASPNGLSFAKTSGTYWVFDHKYQTYVCDLQGMKKFAPNEAPALDRFSIDIPLLRYES